MRRRTKYTCPTLMTVSMWVERLRRGRDWIVEWEYPDGSSEGAYIGAHKIGRSGGYEIQCKFPRWMVMTEIWIRRLFRSRFFLPYLKFRYERRDFYKKHNDRIRKRKANRIDERII